MKKIFTALCCLGILTCMLLACAPSSATKVGSGAGTTTTKTKTNQEFKVGDQIQLNKRVLTVGAITRNFTSSNEYIKAPDGKEWIVVPVIIENKGDAAASFNPLDFYIQDSQGGRTQSAFVMDLPNELKFGEIAPGGRVEGNIAFEVVKDAAGLKLIFKPTFGWEGEVIVVL